MAEAVAARQVQATPAPVTPNVMHDDDGARSSESQKPLADKVKGKAQMLKDAPIQPPASSRTAQPPAPKPRMVKQKAAPAVRPASPRTPDAPTPQPRLAPPQRPTPQVVTAQSAPPQSAPTRHSAPRETAPAPASNTAPQPAQLADTAPPETAPPLITPGSSAPAGAPQQVLKSGRPARAAHAVRLVGPIETGESSEGSGDEFMPAAPSNKKGKAKAKRSDSEKDDEGEAHSDVEMGALSAEERAPTKPTHKRRDPAPVPGGEVHIPPCGRCKRKSLPCTKEIGGGACFPCVKLKSKCDYSGVKGQRGFGEKKQRRRRTSYNRVPWKRGTPEKVVRSKKQYLEVQTDEDEADMTEPEANVPQRRTAGSHPAALPARSSPPAPASHLVKECEYYCYCVCTIC